MFYITSNSTVMNRYCTLLCVCFLSNLPCLQSVIFCLKFCCDLVNVSNYNNNYFSDGKNIRRYKGYKKEYVIFLDPLFFYRIVIYRFVYVRNNAHCSIIRGNTTLTNLHLHWHVYILFNKQHLSFAPYTIIKNHC